MNYLDMARILTEKQYRIQEKVTDMVISKVYPKIMYV